jgi:transposase
MTRRLLDYIEKESLLRPFCEVAPEVGLSPKTVRQIFRARVAVCERTATSTAPRVLGIDGVYIERKERAILTDIEKGSIIDIWGSIKTDPLAASLHHLPNFDQIEVVVMDMAKSLKSAVKQALPNAIIVVDRYHIQRMANEALDHVRKRLRSGMQRRGGQLTMCKSSLLRKHRGQLKKNEEIELERWFTNKPDLQMAYQLKEEFFEIWRSSSKATARERYRQWLDQVPLGLSKDFKPLITAMQNWGEYIFNYFDHRCTNAFTESTNRRIKDIQREARNGRFETVRAKAIYGTLVRQQLKAARSHPPNQNKARTKRASKQGQENLSAISQQPSIQLALF